LVQQKETEHLEKDHAKEGKDCHKLLRRIDGIQQLHAIKGYAFNMYNAKECKLFLQYKKTEDDAAMPSKINDLHA